MIFTGATSLCSTNLGDFSLKIVCCKSQVKDTLNHDKYRAFLKVFLDYNTNTCYESFKTGLFRIFDEPQWFYILEGMVRFTRSAHRDGFEKDVVKFKASRSK